MNFKPKMFFRILFLLAFVGLSVGKYLKKFCEYFWKFTSNLIYSCCGRLWRRIWDTSTTRFFWAISARNYANHQFNHATLLWYLMFADASRVIAELAWMDHAINRSRYLSDWYKIIQSWLFFIFSNKWNQLMNIWRIKLNLIYQIEKLIN